MSRMPIVVLTTLGASLLAAVSVAAQAKDVASCKPYLDARMKQFTTPTHIYITQPGSGPGAKLRTSEEIMVGGIIYVELSGTWTKSPLTLQQMANQEKENIQNATALSCHRVRDEAVNGVAAVVYSAHTENDGMKSDARTWIAKGSGLVLREEEDLDTGDASASHISIRYDYSNVHAPAVN